MPRRPSAARRSCRDGSPPAPAREGGLYDLLELIAPVPERTEGWNDAMRRSASWRLTAPLRAAKRTLRGRRASSG